ncbi:MAG: TonB family protein, partial [Myxococcaceae bacterium]
EDTADEGVTEVGQGQGGPGAEPGGASADPNLLARIHARLAESARRCYPPAARRYRLTGEVQMSFCLDGHGGVSRIAASRSSGSALLDRAAVDCVVPGAAPLPGPSTCVSVAVQFR